MQLWHQEIFDSIRVSDLFYAVLTAIFAFVVASSLFNWGIKALERAAEKTRSDFDDFLVAMLRYYCPLLFYFAAVYWGLQELPLAPKISHWIYNFWIVGIVFILTKMLLEFLNFTFPRFLRSKRLGLAAQEQGAKGLLAIFRVIVWLGAIIFILDNLGLKISTVVTGLGIGGVAIALAAQAFLGDFFNYFAILFDRPFEVGDRISVNDVVGVVEEIGIKTTRLRGVGGELLIFSNSDLMKARLRNLKQMVERRVSFFLHLSYETTPEQIEALQSYVSSCIEELGIDLRFDRCNFHSYTPAALQIEVAYTLFSNDGDRYLALQHRLNVKIKHFAEQSHLRFAAETVSKSLLLG